MTADEEAERAKQWRERIDRELERYLKGGGRELTEDELVAVLVARSPDVHAIPGELQRRLILGMRDLQASNEATASTIKTLTAWLVGLTIMLVVLTITLVVLTAAGALG